MPDAVSSPSAAAAPPWALVLASLVMLAGLAASGWSPHDRLTWWMEVLPAIIALPLMWATAGRWRLSTLLYALIALHGLVLMLGGAYTYARVPLGFTMQEWWHLARNPYDKIGHFMQGFVPALVAREILLRGGWLPRGRMLGFLCLCVVLAISATYELIEWGAAVAMGQGADEFLGTQGDPWDTQSDMGFAGLGALCAMLLIPAWHDRSIARAEARSPWGGPPRRR